ncbi:MAG: GC-type dockerin domain-anchored protein, partial [Phycisphaerales bacterium]
TPASGYDGVSVQWRRNGVAIVDGPGGASVGGGTVSGAARVLASPTDGTGSVLTIAGARMSDAGTYTATFTNACGEVTTLPAAVGVDPCPADFDADGVVDGEDVIGFFAAWDASNAAADFNRDGGVDSDDVIGFFARWDSGC